jgi:hypothetical protein
METLCRLYLSKLVQETERQIYDNNEIIQSIVSLINLKKMRNIIDITLRLKFILSPFGGSTHKKALAFGKGVGKTGVFPWRKVGQTCEVSQEQIIFAKGEGGYTLEY